MSELTDRGKRFKAAIAGFIGKKLEKKPKDEHGNFAAASAEECESWLAAAVQVATKLYTATHVLKATHPKAVGSEVYAPLREAMGRIEVGTHSVVNFEEDIIASSAAYLGASSFLRAEVEGRRIVDWVRADDADLRMSLNARPDIASSWMETLRCLSPMSGGAATHPLAKQLYWLVGDDPLQDAHYHLLQPLFSSTLMHAVHADIQDARFGEANKEARQAFRDKRPSDLPYRDYRGLVARKLGGTKPQNISQLNSERGGVNYLMASLPPPAWKPSGTQLLKQETVFDGLIWFGGMRELVRALSDFLLGDPDPTMETRQHRKSLEQAIGQELAMFGATVRGQYEPGWTRDTACQLQRCEQLWLDPDRTELPVRSDDAHPEQSRDDADFNADYHNGDWADEVAERFGNWLNARLHKAGLVTVSLPERNHWARQAIIDLAWPVPRQRRTVGGAG